MPDVKFGGGSKQKPSTSTMTRNVAPPSPGESILQLLNEQVAQQQAQGLQRAMQSQQQYESSPLFGQLQGLQGQAATGLEGIMGGQQLLQPAQQQALQQYYQSIMQPQMDQMRQVAGQEAARRGMTISDSPIGGDFLRQMANYQAQMGGQQAGSALQLQGQNQNMYQNVLNFGQQLQQNANQNRLALAQAQPGSYQFGNNLANQRIASAPVTQTTRGGGSTTGAQYGLNLGNIGQGIAGIGQGISAYNRYKTPTQPTSTRPASDMWF